MQLEIKRWRAGQLGTLRAGTGIRKTPSVPPPLDMDRVHSKLLLEFQTTYWRGSLQSNNSLPENQRKPHRGGARDSVYGHLLPDHRFQRVTPPTIE